MSTDNQTLATLAATFQAGRDWLIEGDE